MGLGHETGFPFDDDQRTEAEKCAAARKVAEQALEQATRAWHEYACLCDVGPERTRAFAVFENVRNAGRG